MQGAEGAAGGNGALARQRFVEHRADLRFGLVDLLAQHVVQQVHGADALSRLGSAADQIAHQALYRGGGTRQGNARGPGGLDGRHRFVQGVVKGVGRVDVQIGLRLQAHARHGDAGHKPGAAHEKITQSLSHGIDRGKANVLVFLQIAAVADFQTFVRQAIALRQKRRSEWAGGDCPYCRDPPAVCTVIFSRRRAKPTKRAPRPSKAAEPLTKAIGARAVRRQKGARARRGPWQVRDVRTG